MNVKERYESAKEMYAAMGVDTDKAVETLEKIAISMHCWQGDDVTGFDQKGPLTGGIQATGNYPGKARTPEELMADIDKVFSLVPGKHKLNLHASYAIFEDGEFADRDKLEPKHFKKWVEFAKERGIGLDFNPTFFSHSKVVDGLTLSSPIDEVRNFWIEHGKACVRISQYFAEELGIPCAMNIWNVIIMMNFIRGLPRAVEEAAFVDGANHWQTLFRVILPMSKPSLASLLLFSMIGHWNAWFDGMFYMNNPNNYPMATYLATQIINNNQSMTNMTPEQLALLSSLSEKTVRSAQLFISIIPILVVYPFLQKFFVKGITVGSVKE